MTPGSPSVMPPGSLIGAVDLGRTVVGRKAGAGAEAVEGGGEAEFEEEVWMANDDDDDDDDI